MGRPRFDPTDEQRKLVKALAAFGCPQSFIATQVMGPKGTPISEQTLKNKFRRELQSGEPQLINEAGTWLVNHMRGRSAQYDTTGKLVAKEIAPDIKAAIFILETRGKDYGWTKRSELTGKDGMPLGSIDLTRLSDNEVREFERLAQKAAGEQPEQLKLAGPARGTPQGT